MKNTKNIIMIITLLIVVIMMAVGYSAFATQLTLNGTAEIVGEWNVRIADVKVQSVTEGCDAGEPQYTNTSVTFNAKLVKPGDSITYVITIENAGTIDATLNTILFKEQEDGSESIKYSTTELANALKAGEQTSFTVTVECNSENIETQSIKSKTITGIIEYVQK